MLNITMSRDCNLALLPRFMGDLTKERINRHNIAVKSWAQAFRLSNQEAKLYLHKSYEHNDTAQTWFQLPENHQRLYNERFTFEQLQQHLADDIPTSPLRLTWLADDLANDKQQEGETASSYLLRIKLTYADQLDSTTPETICAYVQRNLADHVQQFLLYQERPKTLTDLRDLIKKYEETKCSQPKPMNTQIRELKEEVIQLREAMRQNEKTTIQNTGSQADEGSSTSESYDYYSGNTPQEPETRSCWRCGSRSHLRRDCHRNNNTSHAENGSLTRREIEMSTPNNSHDQNDWYNHPADVRNDPNFQENFRSDEIGGSHPSLRDRHQPQMGHLNY